MTEKRNPITPAERSAAFLDRVRLNQSDKRREVNEIMGKVIGTYLPTAYDREVDAEIESMLDSMLIELGGQPGVPAPSEQVRGGRALLVVGDAGAGKSRVISHVLRNRPEFEGFGTEGDWSPILSVVAPSPFTLGALGNLIVRAAGYEGAREIKHTKVWPFARRVLADRGVRILHIDEAQHGDEISNPDMFLEVENTFKRMMQDSEWIVWLILSGLPELARFCQADDSMKRRVRIVRLEPLRFPDHAPAIRETVEAIAENCPSIDCTTVLTDEFTHRLLHAAMYQFGILVEYVQDAIGECLMAGDEELGIGHFADVYSVRTGETQDHMNVFLARNWKAIAVEKALYEEVTDEYGRPVGRKTRDRQTKGVRR